MVMGIYKKELHLQLRGFYRRWKGGISTESVAGVMTSSANSKSLSLEVDTLVSFHESAEILAAASDELEELKMNVTSSTIPYSPECTDWILNIGFPHLTKVTMTNYKGPHKFLQNMPVLKHLELRYSSLRHYRRENPFFEDDIGKELYNWWCNTDSIHNSKIWEILPTMQTLVIAKFTVWKLRTRFEYTRSGHNKITTTLTKKSE